jgi:hypothetical protein
MIGILQGYDYYVQLKSGVGMNSEIARIIKRYAGITGMKESELKAQWISFPAEKKAWMKKRITNFLRAYDAIHQAKPEPPRPGYRGNRNDQLYEMGKGGSEVQKGPEEAGGTNPGNDPDNVPGATDI